MTAPPDMTGVPLQTQLYITYAALGLKYLLEFCFFAPATLCSAARSPHETHRPNVFNGATVAAAYPSSPKVFALWESFAFGNYNKPTEARSNLDFVSTKVKGALRLIRIHSTCGFSGHRFLTEVVPAPFSMGAAG